MAPSLLKTLGVMPYRTPAPSRLFPLLVACGGLVAFDAGAAPLLLTPPAGREDPGPPGTGACALARHPPASENIGSLAAASNLLSGPLDGVSEYRFPLVGTDFTNGTAISGGDFLLNQSMPYSLGAAPPGDGQLIAMRWRGMLRVATAPWTVTFAVRSDDGYGLWINSTAVVSHPNPRDPYVDTRQVTFTAAGLYPFELIYYQNLLDAMIEWSSADGVLPELSNASALPGVSGAFALLPVTMLVPADDDAQLCGPTCVPCAGATPVCALGVCVSLDGGVPVVDASTGEAGVSPDADTDAGEGGTASDAGGFADVMDAGPADILADAADAGAADVLADASDAGLADVLAEASDAGLADVLAEASDAGLADVLADASDVAPLADVPLGVDAGVDVVDAHATAVDGGAPTDASDAIVADAVSDVGAPDATVDGAIALPDAGADADLSGVGVYGNAACAVSPAPGSRAGGRTAFVLALAAGLVWRRRRG